MIEVDTGPLFIPTLVIGAAALASCLWLYRRVASEVGAGPRTRIILFRALSLLAITVFLINPRWTGQGAKSVSLAVLVDGSRSMQTRDEGRQRLALAKSAVEFGLLPNLPPNAQVELLAWQDGLVPVGQPALLSAAGESSDLPQALRDAIGLPRAHPLAGVIVVSDGAIHSDSPIESVAGFCKRKGIPIHTISIGEGAREPRDIVVESVDCRNRFSVDRPAKLSVTIRSSGYANSAVPVQLKERGKVIAEETLYLNGQSQDLTLVFSPKEQGFRYYEVSIPQQEGERSADNNRRVAGVEVVEPNIRVHYQEGSGRDEAMFIQRALEADPTIKVTIPEPMDKFPLTLAELLSYDVIIFSDIPRDRYSQQQQDNTVRFVNDFGGGFVMIGGHTSFGAGGWNKTVIDRIIPVAMEEERTMGGNFTLAATLDALDHPVMQMMGTRAENKDFWENKPPQFAGIDRVDHAKPGATVLAVNSAEKNRWGPLVVWATQEIGKGRSMAFTTDSTQSWGGWFQTQWGEEAGGSNDTRYYRKFWNSSVKWLAENRLNRSTDPLTLELSQSSCFTGDSVKAVVRVQDANLNPIGDADVSISITGRSMAKPLSLKAPFDESTGNYTISLTPGAGGDLRVTGTAQRPGAKPDEVTAKLRVEQVDTEVFDVRTRPELLRRLSSITNGLSLNADDPALGEKIRSGLHIVSDAPSKGAASMWDRWPILLILLALIAAEWTTRRRNGLA